MLDEWINKKVIVITQNVFEGTEKPFYYRGILIKEDADFIYIYEMVQQKDLALGKKFIVKINLLEEGM